MHTPQARQQAETLYTQRGAAYAAEQTCIPERTIRRWALAGGWQQQMTVVAGQDAETKSASLTAILGWQTRRRTMADQLGHVGQQLLEAIQADLAQRKRLNLRDAGILLGIMLDKAELLAAQTGGTDDSGIDHQARLARLREMAAELGARAKADQGG